MDEDKKEGRILVYLPNQEQIIIVLGEKEALKLQKDILEANTLAWIVYIN